MQAGQERVVRGRVVTPEGEIADGVVIADGDRLAWVGAADEAPGEYREAIAAVPAAPQAYVLPGLVDIHNHGGGGASIPAVQDIAEGLRAVNEHRRYGTTRMLASLVTAAPEVLLARVAVLADLADAGEIEGIHSEGPFLASARCGAQDPAFLIDGDPALVAAMAEAARGHLATMTVAPEVPGAGQVLDALCDVGALPSIGHTDASAPDTRAAVERLVARFGTDGRRPTVTHLFNGMRPLHHREPGPIPVVLAAARRGEVVLELIGDGVHLDPELVRDVVEIVGPQNVALVTDAMAAAGMADGDYRLGSLDVQVADGVARLVEGGSIAGGTAHLIDVVRISVAGGVPLADAVRSASLTPAEVLRSRLGADNSGALFGALRPGYQADVVVTDPDLQVQRVVRNGVDVPRER
ncbi:N-acetylglucosamine-6-phosphate deacetylase [Ruania halotolerans]|uniref:N-acetylglucosamine-6-phosphate deacetylase n=1 Tax=Ruania halotolerans TaxID=2897773 RepID=UPI001E2F2242|nr:amidohydrolase family protein [Ruania halotolerans]UFU07661.1 amidohydrolase family protein [Ruania halotolerans]